MNNYMDHIVIEPTIRFGKATIKGTRITVQDILSWLASGMSNEEIMTDFPELSATQIRAALAFAADRQRRSHLVAA
jgi:uncharacterized protein (DUF433 family)